MSPTEFRPRAGVTRVDSHRFFRKSACFQIVLPDQTIVQFIGTNDQAPGFHVFCPASQYAGLFSHTELDSHFDCYLVRDFILNGEDVA